MTMPDENTGITTEATEVKAFDLDPIPVFVVSKPTEKLAAHFGALFTESVPLATVGAGYVQLLQRRPSRAQAYIRNLDAANAVLIAETLAKVQNGQGFTLPAGQVVKVESQVPLFAVALVAAVNVSVLDESWDTGHKDES